MLGGDRCALMPRHARAILPEVAVHIIQRGNNRSACFHRDADYLVYLDHLRELSRRHGCEIHAYCLMTNHVHLVATPSNEESLAKGIGRTHYLYTRYVNKLHGRSIQLETALGRRFRSAPVGPPRKKKISKKKRRKK